MMSLTFGLFTQVSGSGPLGPLVIFCFLSTEQYEESLKDLNKCLEIQKELLEPDNRLLAETYPCCHFM